MSRMRWIRGCELFRSEMDWSEARESVRRRKLLLGGSCARWDRQENIPLSSAVNDDAML